MSTTAETGLNLTDTLNASILVLTKPSETSFQTARGRVNTLGALVALAIAGAFSGLMWDRSSGLGPMMTGLVAGAVLGIAGYYVIQVILWGMAKLLGGQGDFMSQANLLAIVYAPVIVILVLLALIPFVGPLLAPIVFIYELVLYTLGFKVVHAFSTLRAVLTWLIPVLVVVIVVLVAAGSVIGSLSG